MPSYNTFPDFRVSGKPTGIKWPIKKTPMFKTAISEASSGKEYRYANQPNPKWVFKLDFGYLFDDQGYPFASFQQMAVTLQGFFIGQQGSCLPFLYQDPWDNAVTTPFVFALGDGTTTSFQVTRGLGNPGIAPVGVEAIQWAVSPQYFINGVLQTSGHYTQSSPPQVVTFNTPPGPGASISWTGSFQYLCRFNQDKFDFVHEAQGWWTTGLEFISILA